MAAEEVRLRIDEIDEDKNKVKLVLKNDFVEHHEKVSDLIAHGF